MNKILYCFIFSTVVFFSPIFASGGESEKFNLTEVIEHHLADSPEFPLNFGGTKVYEGESGYDSTKATFEDHSSHKRFHYVGGFDMHITRRVTMMWIVSFFLIITFIPIARKIASNPYRVHSRATGAVEAILQFLQKDVIDVNMHGHGHGYYGYLFSLFFFILFSNLIWLVSYSFTVTIHLISTFALALAIFLGLNIITIRDYGFKIFSLFLPSGTSIYLALLLVPIEIISYFFKPISLAIRLFANMMAGHTLLKVIAGFSWSLLSFNNILFFTHFIPLAILIPLFALELGVAFIQAYVFVVLISLYLNDALNLH